MDVGVCVDVGVGVGDGIVGDGVVEDGVDVSDVWWTSASVSAMVSAMLWRTSAWMSAMLGGDGVGDVGDVTWVMMFASEA